MPGPSTACQLCGVAKLYLKILATAVVVLTKGASLYFTLGCCGEQLWYHHCIDELTKLLRWQLIQGNQLVELTLNNVGGEREVRAANHTDS